MNRERISFATEFPNRGNPDIEDTVFLANFLANAIHASSRSFDSLRVSYSLDGVLDRHLHLDRAFRGIRLFSAIFIYLIFIGGYERVQSDWIGGGRIGACICQGMNQRLTGVRGEVVREVCA